MSRSFSAVSLVTLPILNVYGALSLSAELMTKADATELPEETKGAYETLKKRRQELHEATRKQYIAPLVDPVRAREADRQVDLHYRALDQNLESFELIAGTPQARDAGLVRSAIFSEGLRFTQLPFKDQWAASDTRIAQIQKDGFDAIIRRLGGGAILEGLYAAHAEYGEALGITAERAEDTVPSLREPLDHLRDAVRTYVVALVASIKEDDPSSAVLVDRLLQPIDDRPVRRTPEESEPQTAEPPVVQGPPPGPTTDTPNGGSPAPIQ